MKKLFSVILAMTMLLALTGCGASAPAETTAPAASATGECTLEELLNKIVEIQPVEFMGGTVPVDLTDTSEDGLWALKRYTGLDSADQVTEAAVFEPMMGSIAYSMVTVRVAEGVDTKTVAEAMKAGVNPAKWVCVMADDMKVAAYGDVVILIMLASDTGLTAQSFVDAFQKAVGGELTFVI